MIKKEFMREVDRLNCFLYCLIENSIERFTLMDVAISRIYIRNGIYMKMRLHVDELRVVMSDTLASILQRRINLLIMMIQ